MRRSRRRRARAEAAFLDELRARSTRASTRGARSTSTTAEEASTRRRRSRSTSACCARPSSATRTRPTRPRRPPRRSWSAARAAVLRYFRAPESEYECIFTANASGALRLVGEAYPFGPAGRFLATADNHNSVNGIREFARAKGARTAYVPLESPDLRVDDERAPRPARRRRRRTRQPVRLPGAVQLLRRQAPAGVDRASPRTGLGRPGRRRRVRADQPARSVGVDARLRRDLLLQAVRLSDRAGRAAGAPRRAPPAGSPVVRRRHRGRGERRGRPRRAAVRSRPVRGRHGRLPRHPGDRDRAAPRRADRDRRDLAARRGARDVAARPSWGACATPAAARRSASTARRRGTAAGRRSR